MGTGMAARATALLAAVIVAMTVVGAAAATFPIDGDGAYTVNVVRQSLFGDATVPPVTVVDEVGASHASYQPRYAVDGAGEKLQWDGQVAADPARAASVQITLDDTFTLKKFNHSYIGGNLPASYQIDVSTSGFGSMTTVVSSPGVAPSANQIDVLATPVDAKYIKYTWLGTGASRYVLLQEFQAYADQTTARPPATADGFDLIALGSSGPVTAQKTSANWLGDSANAIIDLNQFSYLRGAGTGDAVVEVDLGASHTIGSLSLGFYQGQTWAAGARIDLSEDGVAYTTVFDQTSSLASSQDIPITWTRGRYIQITNYGGSGGAMSDLQVFAVPEPATLTVLALVGGLAFVRRRRTGAALARALCLTCAALLCHQVAAATYTDPTLVNLFRQVDAAGTNIVQTQWTALSAGGSVQYGSFYGVDSGNFVSQLSFGTQDPGNAASYQVTLAAPVHIEELTHLLNGSSHRPTNYRILGSTTGFGSMTELVGWTDGTGTTGATHTVDTTVQYVQYDFLGTQDSQYLQVKEFMARPAATDSVDIKFDGHNLFAERSTAGPIPDTPTYRGGSWGDNPNNLIDLNVDSLVRGNMTSTESWFIIPLNDQYTVVGAAMGAYHGQTWPDITIDVTADAVIDGSTTWTEVYSLASGPGSRYMPFGGEYPARFVRLTQSGAWGAATEFELFAVPEPGTAVVLGLGLLALRRRK